MRIIQLSAENVKRIKAVSITPAGPVVEVAGKNGSGKTSVLDSIWWALGGKDGIQAVPIRKGADKAAIRLDLGDIIVDRKFNASGTTTLTVTNKGDGALHRSPQALLDSLMGRMSFDPLAFAKSKPRDQYNEIRRIANVSVDLDELDAQNRKDFDERTEINRRAKSLKAQADGIKVEAGPLERVDVSALATEMQNAADHNANVTQAKRDLEVARSVAEALGKTAKVHTDGLPALLKSLEADMEAEIVAIREKFAGRKLQAEQAKDKANRESGAAWAKVEAFLAIPDPVDLSTLKARIDDADRVNRACDLQAQRAGLTKQAAELEREAAKLTAAIAERDAQKAKALESAEMPVPGLSLSDGVVMLDGLPLEQASDAQQLRLSVAVAMSANSKLRVIRIRDGSLLDEDGMKILAEMAAERDYQVWIERVDSSGQVGIVMVDGEVAADNQAVSE